MTTPIVIRNTSSQGQTLQASFLPEQGMNMCSYKKGEIEVIDQSTRNLFEERYAGLGALIGPHFHHRNTTILPKISDETLFPHIARVKAKGVADPFSHGIARYAPWNFTATENSIAATLTGKDTWQGVPLARLEGQNFVMHYRATLQPDGLQIEVDVVSDTDSLVGLHYYYHLPQGHGKVIGTVQPRYLDQQGVKLLPSQWGFDEKEHRLTFDLAEEADYTFFPFPNRREGKIILDTGEYRLKINYTCPSQENCWQLYHPKGASFVCVEPISAQDPHHPNLTASSLKVHLEIVGEKNVL